MWELVDVARTDSKIVAFNTNVDEDLIGWSSSSIWL
jgi:hypothetical protein